MQFSHKWCNYAILLNKYFLKSVNSILNKEPVKRAKKSIKEFDPNLKIVCLEQTARTAQDAATALGCSVGAIVKSLLFSAGESFILCLISGDKRCSLKTLKKF